MSYAKHCETLGKILGKTRGLGLMALVAGLVATTLVGCNDHPLDPFENVVTAVNRQENALPAKTKIDFLFMVDNSGSMCEEQRNLTDNFNSFSNFLFDELGGAADYRIAVITTDMARADAGKFLNQPAPPVPALNCLDPQTNEPIAPDTANCGNIDNLQAVIKAEDVVDRDDLTLRFQCLATLGTSGDGFEKGLESMRTSLSCAGPNREFFGTCCNMDGTYNPACVIAEDQPEPTFLRPDALLVVVFITDEDDCSDPASNPGLSRRAICKYGTVDSNPADGIPDGYGDTVICGDRSPIECFQAECGGSGPCNGGACPGSETCVQGQCVRDATQCAAQRCEISRSENSNCEWFRGDLVPVNDYFRFLTGLKPQPLEQLLVASVVGLRAYTENGFEITYNPGTPPNRACDMDDPTYDANLPLDTCCPNGRCSGRIQPSCESDNGVAFAGRRYLELAEQFGANGIGCPEGAEEDASECVHICVNNFAGPLERIKERVANLIGSYCLDKPPACEAVDADGNLRPCVTAEEIANTDNYNVQVRTQCLLTENEGGKCPFIQAPQLLASDQFDLVLEEPSCPGGARVQLTEPPIAGSDVILQFSVNVSNQSNRAPASDAGAGNPSDAAAPAADAGL